MTIIFKLEIKIREHFFSQKYGPFRIKIEAKFYRVHWNLYDKKVN
jgi:hypothetical protein